MTHLHTHTNTIERLRPTKLNSNWRCQSCSRCGKVCTVNGNNVNAIEIESNFMERLAKCIREFELFRLVLVKACVSLLLVVLCSLLVRWYCRFVDSWMMAYSFHFRLHTLQKCHLRLRPLTEVAIPDKWIELIKAISFTLHTDIPSSPPPFSISLTHFLYPSGSVSVSFFCCKNLWVVASSWHEISDYIHILTVYSTITHSCMAAEFLLCATLQNPPTPPALHTQNAGPARYSQCSLHIYDILACTCLWCITQQTVDRPSQCVRLSSEQNKFSTVQFNVKSPAHAEHTVCMERYKSRKNSQKDRKSK